MKPVAGRAGHDCASAAEAPKAISRIASFKRI